jgi:MoxR-like ATPase
MNEQSLPFHPRVGDQLALRDDAVKDHGHIAYDYTDEIVLGVNAALSTDRPLLMRGNPGCGKSTLARDVAIALAWDFEEKVITSRTTATDLQWTFDAIHRLSDTGPLPERARNPGNYVTRGVLWNAFDPKDAAAPGAVALVDEIDKADPDVPNDLLVPLGEGRIVVTDTEPHMPVTRRRMVLVVITTNGERELPPAFLRRCVSITLADPREDPVRLERIARSHFVRMARGKSGPDAVWKPELLTKIVTRVDELSSSLAPLARRPGTAEILDALKACVELALLPDTGDWRTLTRLLLHKESGNPDAKRETP